MVHFSGYNRYPMYVSPFEDRIRKRKAFADTELDSSSHLFMLSSTPTFSMKSSSLTTTSTISTALNNLSSPYTTMSQLPMIPPSTPTIPSLTMHLSNVIDYRIQTTPPPPPSPSQSKMNTMNENDTYDYVAAQIIKTEHRSNFEMLSPRQQIRIIDDAKLYNMNTKQKNYNESYILSSVTDESAHSTGKKPKLSFSIESIIGIK